jgi:SAM-dependent methyltransferase
MRYGVTLWYPAGIAVVMRSSLFDMSRRRWLRFAADEPYFAVLAYDRYLAANIDDAATADFFASGEGHVRELFDNLYTHLTPRLSAQTVLELGCGPGRLALPFAHRVAHVTAVDVSPEMLRVAAANAAARGFDNITFQQYDDFVRDEKTFDLVNAHLVLQRIPPREGAAVVREMARRVADGGVSVVHVPYRIHQSAITAASRWLRSRVPAMNAAFNLIRRKPLHLPLMPTYTHELDVIFAILEEHGLTPHYCVAVKHGDVDSIVIHSRKAPKPAPPAIVETSEDATLIDVKKLIADSSIDELNEKAEAYFSSLANWDHHLAKPFARADESPALLINLAVILQGLKLSPGMSVVDFGGGTGWLSRILTQLRCKAILLDVSPTALKIARELYERLPVIGEHPEPQFLHFDGRRIDLPDHSVDRIVCFDAFHHSTDPDAMLQEFGRILVPGGIAAFAEPGPNHSKTPQSQFEMRNYGVVENDIDLDAIWRSACQAGFVDLRVAAFNIPPFHVHRDDYQDILEGRGIMFERWSDTTRYFMRDVRDFFLIRAGGDALDSRSTEGLSCRIEVSGSRVTATNTGRATWLPASRGIGGVYIGAHLPGRFDYARVPLEEAVPPGGSVTVEFDLPPGSDAEFDCVAEGVIWFTQLAGGRTVSPSSDTITDANDAS